MPDVIPVGTKVNVHKPKKSGGIWGPGDVLYIGEVVSGPTRGQYRVRAKLPGWMKGITKSGYHSGWYYPYSLTIHYSNRRTTHQ